MRASGGWGGGVPPACGRAWARAACPTASAGAPTVGCPEGRGARRPAQEVRALWFPALWHLVVSAAAPGLGGPAAGCEAGAWGCEAGAAGLGEGAAGGGAGEAAGAGVEGAGVSVWEEAEVRPKSAELSGCHWGQRGPH